MKERVLGGSQVQELVGSRGPGEEGRSLCLVPGLSRDWLHSWPAHPHGPEASAGGRGGPAGLPSSPVLLCGLHGGSEPVSAVSGQPAGGMAGAGRGEQRGPIGPWQVGSGSRSSIMA